MLRGILGQIVSVDKGITHTALQLTIRPSAVITGYWAGRTVQYTHPAGYLIVSVAVFTLAFRLFGGSTGAGDGDRIFMLLIIPFVAAASRVLFWRARYNYAEHLIAVLYLCGHVLLGFGVLSIGISLMSGPALTAYTVAVLTLGGGYFLWGYSRVFQARPLLVALAGLGALVLGSATWLSILALLVNWFRR